MVLYHAVNLGAIMLRISKLTDYAMVILAYMGQEPERVRQASEIAEQTAIAKPTVSKLLKQLTKNNILTSMRGATGGYKLADAPERISIAQIITALEGPVAITECNLGQDHCAISNKCQITSPWLKINAVIYHALASYSLNDLLQPHAWSSK